MMIGLAKIISRKSSRDRDVFREANQNRPVSKTNQSLSESEWKFRDDPFNK